ncbi:hypothetical protein DIPPA_31918 [Diplonema papillatum]|nr:hypothetical protein DIPPA_31918 [Diplonema papillatum]
MPKRLRVIFSLELVPEGARQFMWLLDDDAQKEQPVGKVVKRILSELFDAQGLLDVSKRLSKNGAELCLGTRVVPPAESSRVLLDDDTVLIRLPKQLEAEDDESSESSINPSENSGFENESGEAETSAFVSRNGCQLQAVGDDSGVSDQESASCVAVQHLQEADESVFSDSSSDFSIPAAVRRRKFCYPAGSRRGVKRRRVDASPERLPPSQYAVEVSAQLPLLHVMAQSIVDLTSAVSALRSQVADMQQTVNASSSHLLT